MDTKIQDDGINFGELADGVEDELLSVQGVDHADQRLLLQLPQVDLAGVRVDL